MSSYKVRPATLRDAKAIAEIHVASWQTAYKDLMPEEDLKKLSVEKRQTFWREAIEYSEPQLLVAIEADEPVGFVGLVGHGGVVAVAISAVIIRASG